MPPKRELSIRLRADLREALDQAVIEQGQSLTSLVEDALAAYLRIDGLEPGQTLADRVRELEARVAALEGNAMHRTASQRHAPPKAPTAEPLAKPAQPSGEDGQHPKADGQRWLTTAQAVAASAARGGPDSRSTLLAWAEDGRLAQIGLRHCPHGTRHKMLASFEDLRVEG